ncbi:MAG: hypothetical protein ACRC5M_04645 [Anaeroplasmataceae bacterium]
MSKDLEDKYRGSFNSDEYTINSKNGKADEYFHKMRNIDDTGPLGNEDVGETNSFTVESDDGYYKEVHALYANVLNANGSNLLDPYNAYLTHFNKLQRFSSTDIQRSGKTYIFITRPDLNFWEPGTGTHNVETVDLFSYFSRMNIGISVMPWLMFPHNMKLEFGNKNRPMRASRNKIGLIDLFEGDMGDRSIRNNAFTPFIPLLSNFCTSSSGGQDLSIDTEETEGDLHGNKLKYAKGADASFAPGEITLEFTDVQGLPIMHLFNLWIHYIHYLTKGVVSTWAKYVQYRIIDYTCSMYIFETASDNATILRWNKITGAFPTSIPLGTIQHNIDIKSDKLKDLSIPFAYNRSEPMKPAVLSDFNFLMNKFIFDESKLSRDWIKATGTAPSKLIRPHEGYSIQSVLDNDPAIPKPSHMDYISSDRNKGKDLVPNNTDYYDGKFWGTIPYIINHKLVWIDPHELYSNFNVLSKRGKDVDKAIDDTKKKMFSE